MPHIFLEDTLEQEILFYAINHTLGGGIPGMFLTINVLLLRYVLQVKPVFAVSVPHVRFD
jgi:hypothetical protein